MTPWLAAVCAGRWQLHGIQSARRAGIKVLALDGDPAASGLAVADKSAVVDVRDPAAVIDAVLKSGVEIRGAISFASEAGMAGAAALRERFGLPGPDRTLTDALTNKATQRRVWLAKGVPGPRWKICRSVPEMGAALRELGRPCIFKPIDSAGSRGVTKVDDQTPWEEAARLALDGSRGGAALVESYMRGVEYTVETFAADGRTHVLAVTEKAKVPGTGGTVAQELATPEIPQPLIDAVAGAATSALEALGYRDGPGHVEVILSPEGRPGLVEAAGRGGGFMVFDGLVPKASGFDIATACALQAVGAAPGSVPAARRAVVLRFFPSTPGIVRGITGIESACAMPGVEAAAFVKVGDTVGAVRGDADRMGYILTDAATPQEARKIADLAAARIRFELEESLGATGH